jgi:hypothetical protein
MKYLIFIAIHVFSASCLAELTRIQITSTAPFAGGKAFGATGPYMRVIGRFHGELDPTHPANRGIVDIRLAPRNERGRVEYSGDFEILRPADPAKGNGTLLYDVNNRGNKRAIHLLNDVAASNSLDTPETAGDGFLMRHGFTLAWSGWIAGMPKAPFVLGLEVPNAQGVEAPVWDEFLFNYAPSGAGNDAQPLLARLTFAAASTDKARARLTVRERNEDTPARVDAAGWEFVDERTIRLLPAGTPFRAGGLYQLSYLARNPPVAGIGYAATRDFVAFLRYVQKDRAGTANPLGPEGRHKIAFALAHGTSQSGRFLRDMLYQGFNETEDFRPVFDGINPHIASARLFLNHRFAQPNRAYSMGHGFLGYPDASFPFSYIRMRDDMSRREDSLLERCRRLANCPKIVHTVTSTEYWQGGHSLGTTDSNGNIDLDLPENVRIYHFAGTQHVISQIMPKGVCAAPANTAVDPRPVMRALILALDRWVKGGAPPPPSAYPRIADKTLVTASALKWPAFPAFSAPRSPNPMIQFDYGARIGEGVLDNAPPLALPYRYKVLVPAVDADGNELAGLRVPEQAVPFATATGWALRSSQGGAAGELCYLDGSLFPFARTQEERLAAKDPRPSMAERYGTRAEYLEKVRGAAAKLRDQGFLLPEDVERITSRAEKYF